MGGIRLEFAQASDKTYMDMGSIRFYGCNYLGHSAHDFQIIKKKNSDGGYSNLHMTAVVKSTKINSYEEWEEFYFSHTSHAVKKNCIFLNNLSTVEMF